MAKFIELSTVDEGGSGTLFPTLIDKDEIVSIMDASEMGVNGLKTFIVLRTRERPLFAAATYADLKEILDAE